ncbi:hypothetical protein PGTUg99_024652 [Puccinia graminis f. sp. tritici]|uniref:Uncharacterized protein n=1 Tax=Puccinia graminis f. sp. tritici TaxID=56615 RepID=A0A5B0SJQ3_PUCGR|nr:hypothetical protein PGTUg99_024652 [Puccinia graminis f. sp. tritici]
MTEDTYSVMEVSLLHDRGCMLGHGGEVPQTARPTNLDRMVPPMAAGQRQTVEATKEDGDLFN